MRNKLIVLTLMFASAFVILPATNYAAISETSNSVTVNESIPQIRVRIGQGQGRRNKNKKWNRGNHYGWRNQNRTRLVKQVYYVHGRRYVRYVRVRS